MLTGDAKADAGVLSGRVVKRLARIAREAAIKSLMVRGRDWQRLARGDAL